MKLPRWLLAILPASMLLAVAPSPVAAGEPACPPLFDHGVVNLDFQPGFLHIDRYDTEDGGSADGLTISSFFNVFVRPGQTPPFGFFERDLVARITDIDALDPADFDPDADVEILTDLGFAGPGPLGRTIWPNDALRAPDGVFDFEALVIPQGFHPAAAPGRLTVIDLDDPDRTEYVVHQSTQAGGPPHTPGNSPRFYHRVLFMDMDGDGLEDLVTVRSGFRVVPSVYPPFSELVYFRNPGAALQPNVPWDAVVLYGGPVAGFLGPDIHLEAHDFEGDGVPEIVATHFFSGFATPPGQPPAQNGRIAIYGAPAGGTWADVDASLGALPRVRTLSADQGFPFDVQIVDLDIDGRADVLATNHQPDGCTPQTSSAVPGRVYALEQPSNGDIFGTDWTLHILLDGIRPNPSLAPVTPPGRLAPGRAQAFWPMRALEGVQQPWIIVGGDEASKVWMLRPARPGVADDWNYKTSVVFDINDFYGPGTTQTPLLDPFGRTIGTVGGIAWRYDDERWFGRAEFYIPVFEARDIHKLSFSGGFGSERISCPDTEIIACQ